MRSAAPPVSATTYFKGGKIVHTFTIQITRNFKHRSQVIHAKSERHLGPAEARARLLLLISGTNFIFRATKYFGHEIYFGGDEILHKSTIQVSRNVPYSSRECATSQMGEL
jgi:hypothetical protein